MNTQKTAETIVGYILQDLKNRSGLGNEWEMIDPETQKGIEAVWVYIAKEEIEKGANHETAR